MTIRVGRGLVGLVLAVAILAAGCGGGSDAPTPGGTAAPTPRPLGSAQTAAPASAGTPGSPIAGVITSIDSTGLTQVRGFTLRTDAGKDLTFVIGTLDNGAEFPPGHLAEHLAAAAPILVSFRVQDGKLVAYRLEDAP